MSSVNSDAGQLIQKWRKVLMLLQSDVAIRLNGLVDAVDSFAYGQGCLFVDVGLASNAANARYSICRVNPVNVTDKGKDVDLLFPT